MIVISLNLSKRNYSLFNFPVNLLVHSTVFYLFLLDWNFSSEFQNNFCVLFEIESLSNVIEMKCDVKNEELCIDLFQFYSNSLGLIEEYLLKRSLINDDQWKHFSLVFTRLYFVCVEQIELCYEYQGEIVRKHCCETYLDERKGKFFILKQFQKSEIRYIECLAKYLVQDQRILHQLIAFIMDLSKIYQIEGEQGLIQRRTSLNCEHKWILPNVYSIESTLSHEEIPLNESSVNISLESMEQLMNESIPQRKPPSRLTTDKDQGNNPSCFPSKSNRVQSRDSTSVSNRSSRPRNNDPSTIEEQIFEQIQVSTIIASTVNPFCSSTITINPTDHTGDENTGRVGEQFIYRYLQWKYPDECIKWMNENKESGLPFDIQFQRKDKTIELIEVKTTRVHDQHTFQISIAQLECLLQHPNTYHIYRLYYSDDLQRTKIFIFNQVKNHLEQKQLALCLTFLQQDHQ